MTITHITQVAANIFAILIFWSLIALLAGMVLAFVHDWFLNKFA